MKKKEYLINKDMKNIFWFIGHKCDVNQALVIIDEICVIFGSSIIDAYLEHKDNWLKEKETK